TKSSICDLETDRSRSCSIPKPNSERFATAPTSQRDGISKSCMTASVIYAAPPTRTPRCDTTIQRIGRINVVRRRIGGSMKKNPFKVRVAGNDPLNFRVSRKTQQIFDAAYAGVATEMWRTWIFVNLCGSPLLSRRRLGSDWRRHGTELGSGKSRRRWSGKDKKQAGRACRR